jgi:hypothetical protein
MGIGEGSERMKIADGISADYPFLPQNTLDLAGNPSVQSLRRAICGLRENIEDEDYGALYHTFTNASDAVHSPHMAVSSFP